VVGPLQGRGTESLDKFLTWVRAYDPSIPETLRAEAVEAVDYYLRVGQETRPRRLESIVRVAKALPRLNHRNVERGDIDRAIDLTWEVDQREEGEQRSGGGHLRKESRFPGRVGKVLRSSGSSGN
jgi:DNA replicative helicase MCM subunit Mcm2 (Cdc46/Mcm family)